MLNYHGVGPKIALVTMHTCYGDVVSRDIITLRTVKVMHSEFCVSVCHIWLIEILLLGIASNIARNSNG